MARKKLLWEKISFRVENVNRELLSVLSEASEFLLRASVETVVRRMSSPNTSRAFFYFWNALSFAVFFDKTQQLIWLNTQNRELLISDLTKHVIQSRSDKCLWSRNLVNGMETDKIRILLKKVQYYIKIMILTVR